MQSLKRFAFLILAAATLVAAQKGRDEPQYKIDVDVDLVVFNVTVTDDRGRHAPGLKAGDFQVVEEGVPQKIILFRADGGPATVGLIIDNSGSMGNKRADVSRAALAFAAASNPGDEMFLITFNENVRLDLPPERRFTNDPDEIRSALFRAAPAGMTALYDALIAGLDHLKEGTRDQKALVVLSDGEDNASLRSLDDALLIAKTSSATIYAIGIYDASGPDRNPGVLRKIARMSGGRAYFPRLPGDLAQVWQDIAAGIRSQYTIGYHSSNPRRDGMFRKVKVSINREAGRGFRVTTREGYMAPGSQARAR